MSDFANKTEYETAPIGEGAGGADSDDVDLSVLLAFEEVGGDDEPDFIVELIDLYLADVPRQLSAMRDAVLKADEASLKRHAHTLKGSSANLGANAVALLCEELEKTNSSEAFRPADILINRLEETFARVRRIFSAEREKRV